MKLFILVFALFSTPAIGQQTLSGLQSNFSSGALEVDNVATSTTGFQVTDDQSNLMLDYRLNGSDHRLFDLYNADGITNSIRLRSDGGDSFIDSGNVGIGTDLPAAKLTVDQGTATSITDGIRIQGEFSGSSRTLNMYINSDGKGEIRKGSAGGADNEIVINPTGGNVGIGTGSPVRELHIDKASGPSQLRISSGTSIALIELFAASGQDPRLHFFENSNLRALLQVDASDNRFEMGYDEGGNPGSYGVYLTSQGTSWLANSDESLKRDWREDSDVLGKIKSIRVGRFKYLESDKNHYGVIAQDIEKGFPEIVDQ